MLDSLRTIWDNLTLPRRLALGGILLAVFAGILLLTLSAGKPAYGVLFSGLSSEDAGAVVAKLREQKIEYRLSSGGSTVEVPEDKVYDLRLSMATEGIPSHGNVGLEIFDKNTFGATDFTQRVNYQRALEGELTRTVKTLEGVIDARVHLAMPERSAFSENESPVTASIVLHLSTGYRPTQKQVAGIVRLVSASVERLQPQNVQVVDERGNPLSAGADSTDQSGDQTTQQERLEKHISADLQAMADRVLGPGKAAIRVSAELDWDQARSTSELVRPGGMRGANLPLEERLSKETYRRADSQASPPGVLSSFNTGAAAGQPGSYLNDQTTRKYAVNKETITRTTAPGKLKRLSVAVIIDSQLDATRQQQLRSALSAAVGLDMTPASRGGRGDRIEVISLPFDTSAADKDAKAAKDAEVATTRMAMIRNGAAILIVLVIGGLSLLMMRKPKPPKPTRIKGEKLDVTVGEINDVPALEGMEPLPGGAESIEEQDTPAIRMREIAAQQPEDIAAMISAWLNAPAISLPDVGERREAEEKVEVGV